MQELLGFTATQSGMALMPRTLVMMMLMPFVGKLYGRVPTRLMVGLGIIFTGVGAFQMSRFSLDTGSHNIISAIIFQGFGFSLMSVPLTTTALSRVPRHRLADATGLNSLLRQIGGSIGLAVFASMLERNSVQARASIGAHLNPGRPEVMARMMMMQKGLMARGMDAVSAQAASLRMMAGSVMRQAMVLSFDKLFVLASLLFVVALPLLYFLKSPDDARNQEAAHVDVEI
jgi:DHA2 family multidrug resistance protein